MSDVTLAIVDDERFDEHHAMGPHPERPERLDAARSGLFSVVDRAQTHRIDARLASAEELRTVHRESYLSTLDAALTPGAEGQLDADTFFSAGTREAAFRAAGGAAALGAALMNDVRRGFALLRPPGHHAESDRAMGFCLFNNVAVAAESALAAGAERVAIVDWDVHHGNGTQHSFEGRSDVLVISLHQFPLYPGTGAPEEVGHGEGHGKTVNVALPPGGDDALYGEAFRRIVDPAIRAHAPDVVLVSAGFDAHQRDPLASMELSDAVYGAMASHLVSVAEDLGHGRVGFLLEGGYDLLALESSVRATVKAALGEHTALPEDAITADAEARIARTLAALPALGG